MKQKLSNNATAELMEELGSRVLSASPLPHDKEHQGVGSAPGQSAVRRPTSAATTVTIELRPSETELPSATVVYPRPVKILPPDRDATAGYRERQGGDGVSYKHPLPM